MVNGGWGWGGQAQGHRPSPNLNLIAVLPPALKASLLSACCVLSWALQVRRGRKSSSSLHGTEVYWGRPGVYTYIPQGDASRGVGEVKSG